MGEVTEQRVDSQNQEEEAKEGGGRDGGVIGRARKATDTTIKLIDRATGANSAASTDEELPLEETR